MVFKGATICKPTEFFFNEDSVYYSSNLIAVSDGAGGGGLFAEKWSEYLICNLPRNPLKSFRDLDIWIDSIWENFFNKYEKKAEQLGSLALNKFYEEGSYATLAAIWFDNPNNTYYWMAYGDTTVFVYNQETKILKCSIEKIEDYNSPPFLLSCKDPISPKGFKYGESLMSDNDILFIASDALAHYIILMYMIANIEKFEKELTIAMRYHTKNSLIIQNALKIKNCDFEKRLIKLINSSQIPLNFKRHTYSLYSKKLLSLDDYSFTYLKK